MGRGKISILFDVRKPLVKVLGSLFSNFVRLQLFELELRSVVFATHEAVKCDIDCATVCHMDLEQLSCFDTAKEGRA